MFAHTCTARKCRCQLTFPAKSSRKEERHYRCPVDPNAAYLWPAGRIVSPAGRSGGLTNLVTTPQPIGGTSFSTYPAYAKGIATNERATLSSGDRCNRNDWAKDYPRHPAG